MSLSRETVPPQADKSSYVIDTLDGEILTIPGSKNVYRILTPKIQETENTMAVFTNAGVLSDAPGFHHHEEAHDVFLVTKGAVKLWNGDKCKILGPGDFAYVPPTIVHNPQLVATYTETFGFICPAAWIDFFRYIGEPYEENAILPEFDDRKLGKEIFGKIMKAKGQFDVHFHPHHVPAEVSDWSEEDEKLPETSAPYYLKANTGPRWVLGGVMSRPFITTKQTGGRFAISSIESSAMYGGSVFDELISFPKVHQCFCVTDGTIELKVGDASAMSIIAGESAFVPAGTEFSLKFTSKFAKLISFTTGDGIESIIHEAGEPCKSVVIPEKAAEVDQKNFEEVLTKLGVTKKHAVTNGAGAH